jgi:hypothetical protein
MDSADLSVGVVPVGLAASAPGEFAGNQLGVDYRYRLSCEDSAGAALAECGGATSTARIDVGASGDIALPNFSGSFKRQADWSLSGAQTGNAVFDGDDTLTFDVEFRSLFRPVTLAFHVDSDARYDRVTVHRSTHTVVGGSMHFTLTADRSSVAADGTGDSSSNTAGTAGGSFEMTADVTFSAGASTLVLDGSHAYGIDATTGRVTPVPSE